MVRLLVKIMYLGDVSLSMKGAYGHSNSSNPNDLTMLTNNKD